jgi:hypothetical protein
MTSHFPIPPAMKMVYCCRHVLERQDLFSNTELSARREIGRKYGNSPDSPVEESRRVIYINEFDHEDFRREGGLETPFVLKGLLSESTLGWSDLCEKYGASRVPVHPDAILGSEWQYRRTCDMRLADAMRAMEEGAPLSVVSTSQVFTDNTELIKTPQLELLRRMFGVEFLRVEMFIGGAGTGSAFHCAGGGNFFHMICGRKRWLLVAPEDSFAMYPTIGRNRKSSMFCSPIVSDLYDRAQRHSYPLYSKVAKYAVTLEAGDILFVPGWWWHEVKNLAPSIGLPSRSYVAGRNNFFFVLSLLSGHGVKYLSRVLASNLTGKSLCLMTDGIPKQSFGGKKPRT